MNANAEKWVAALRSGEYAQAKGALRAYNSYCCLGVACDLYAKETGQGEWLDLEILEDQIGVRGAITFRVNEWEGRYTLPSEVQGWLGLSEEAGKYLDPDWVSLADLNDLNTPFDQIADIIESQPTGLFE